MQLQPQESFTIVRQLEDPTDTATYYVQAVVRNAMTDTVISTVNLTDQGDRRFSKAWQVPADPSGQGFWVSILTSVYTDSGYTTKSDNYGEKIDTWLIQDRYKFNPNYPIVTGPDIDYKRIRKIIKEVIREEEKTEPPEVDIETPMAKLSLEIAKLRAKVAGIKLEPTDISPIVNQLKEMKTSFDSMCKKMDMTGTKPSEVVSKKEFTDVFNEISTKVNGFMDHMMAMKETPTTHSIIDSETKKETASPREEKEPQSTIHPRVMNLISPKKVISQINPRHKRLMI